MAEKKKGVLEKAWDYLTSPAAPTGTDPMNPSTRREIDELERQLGEQRKREKKKG